MKPKQEEVREDPFVIMRKTLGLLRILSLLQFNRKIII